VENPFYEERGHRPRKMPWEGEGPGGSGEKGAHRKPCFKNIREKHRSIQKKKKGHTFTSLGCPLPRKTRSHGRGGGKEKTRPPQKPARMSLFKSQKTKLEQNGRRHWEEKRKEGDKYTVLGIELSHLGLLQKGGGGGVCIKRGEARMNLGKRKPETGATKKRFVLLRTRFSV